MAMRPMPKMVLGSIAFAIFWVLAVFPAVPFLPVGRTAGSLFGAMLMVVFQVITPDQAYDAINLPILGLLFGTMVVSVYLEDADMFKHLGKMLSWKSNGPKDLLCRICLISGILSALFTNDTTCVVLTEFVLKTAKQHNLPPLPFLLALASSANIGSSATPIGNPQNLVIAVQSNISFGRFLRGVIPAMLLGITVNASILLVMYWNVLSVENDEENANREVRAENFVNSHRFSPATMSRICPLQSELDLGLGSMDFSSSPNAHNQVEIVRNRFNSMGNEIDRAPSSPLESAMSPDGSCPRTETRCMSPTQVKITFCMISEGNLEMFWKSCVYLVTLGMLISLICGLDMSWTAITAALVLILLDFKDARPGLEKVSYLLLVFFCGMFITVDGFNKTGIPSTLWDLTEPNAKIDRASGIAVLAIVILLLSNVASNVPTVLLLGARVAASAAAISAEYENKAWLILAWVSTVAGNLSLLGSAANLIVCEQARRAPGVGYDLTFWSHFKFGVPSTLIVTAVGLLVIR